MDNSIVSFIGIDVAKDKLDIHVRPENRDFSTANTPEGFQEIVKQLPAPTTCLIALESTGSYHKSLAEAMIRAGHFVAVANPRHVRSFAIALGLLAKTDKIDARIIAHYAETARPRTMSLSPENQVKIVELVTRRRQLLDMRTAEKNRLETIHIQAVRRSLEQMLKTIDKQIKTIEKQIAGLLKSDDDWNDKADLLLSVPGVGPITVASLLADLPELGRLNRKEIAALAGLAPYNNDSGRKHGKRSIHGGRKPIRSVLYMAALTAMRCNDVIRKFADRLKAQGKSFKVVVTACMRKLLVILNTMVKNNTQWEPQNA